MKVIWRAACVVVGVSLAGHVLATELLSKERYIDYSAQMKCAEQMYSFNDPDKYEKEQSRIEKAFGIKDKDIESGKMDDMSAAYDADAAVYDAIDEKKAVLCPEPMD